MFEIEVEGDKISLRGWLDANHSDRAGEVLSTVVDSATVDFSQLEYISSAGLGALFAAQKRLLDEEKGLTLVNLSDHIRDLLETLTPKEAEILSLRYGLNGEKRLSLREIGRRYRLSRERVRQIEKKAITKLRAPSCRRLLEAYVT